MKACKILSIGFIQCTLKILVVPENSQVTFRESASLGFFRYLKANFFPANTKTHKWKLKIAFKNCLCLNM